MVSPMTNIFTNNITGSLSTQPFLIRPQYNLAFQRREVWIQTRTFAFLLTPRLNKLNAERLVARSFETNNCIFLAEYLCARVFKALPYCLANVAGYMNGYFFVRVTQLNMRPATVALFLKEQLRQGHGKGNLH